MLRVLAVLSFFCYVRPPNPFDQKLRELDDAWVMNVVTVNLTDDGFLLLKGGSIHGRDDVYRAVTSWPGWKRLNILAKVADRHVSCYRAPLNPSSAFFLTNATGFEIHWGDKVQLRASLQLHAVQRAKASLTSKPLAGLRFPGRVPMQHQMQAVAAINDLGGSALLADDMGLGKTSTALWAMSIANIDRILVICPASVKYNWEKEMELTLGNCFRWVISGTSGQRADIFAGLASCLHSKQDRDRFDGPKTMVAIINYDLLRMLPEQQMDLLKELCDDAGLICDESHYLKSIDSERTKLVRDICVEAKPRCRLLLTGTPIRNTVADVFSQVEIVQPGTWTSIWDFRKRYLITSRVTFGAKTINKVVGTKHISELNMVLNTVQIRRKKEDVLDLPPKIHTYPELELDEHTRSIYDAMRDYAIYKLDAIEEDTPLDLPASHPFYASVQGAVQIALRCEQLCQGFVGGIPEPVLNTEIAKILVSARASKIKGRAGELLFPFSTKIVWLKETIKTLLQTDQNPGIFGNYNGPLFWLKEQYGDAAFFMHGGTSAEDRRDMLMHWDKGERKIFLCQVRVAIGFDLLRSQDVIFIGRDWDPFANFQAENRFHRIGTKGTVNIQIPIVRDTIEVKIHKRLAMKSTTAEKVLAIRTVKELKEAL